MNAQLEKTLAGVKAFWSAPDTVQKAGIIGAGIAVYPLLVALIVIIWKGGWAVVHQAKQLDILGNLSLAMAALFALIVVALLGVVKTIKAELPGGASIDLDLQNMPSMKPTSVEVVSTQSTKTTTQAETPNA
jgi:hypothetical protein